jgi:hypothetical protein
MKVYCLPEQFSKTVPQHSLSMSWNELIVLENKHKDSIISFFKKKGYTGSKTGYEYNSAVADGHSRYLIIDGGRGKGLKSFLLHLPYGDAWYCRDVEHLPKNVVFKRATAGPNSL